MKTISETITDRLYPVPAFWQMVYSGFMTEGLLAPNVSIDTFVNKAIRQTNIIMRGME